MEREYNFEKLLDCNDYFYISVSRLGRIFFFGLDKINLSFEKLALESLDRDYFLVYVNFKEVVLSKFDGFNFIFYRGLVCVEE